MLLNHDSEATAWYAQTSSTQTMRTWARRITAPADVPKNFQGVFQTGGHPFPYTLHLPEDRFSLFSKRREKLLCVFEDRLVLHEAHGDQMATMSSAFGDVVCILRGTVLLTSWLTIRTLAGTFSLKFNTTNMEYFEPVIETLRSSTTSSSGKDNAEEHLAELAKFDEFSSVNYKYMNYGRQSVRSGDTVLGVAYQPERRIQGGVSFFNTTLFRRYATSHLTILTGQELILIQEAKPTRYDRTNLYGGVFTYIPRANITKIAYAPSADGSVCAMNITLPGNAHVVAEFSSDNASFTAFRQLCDGVLMDRLSGNVKK